MLYKVSLLLTSHVVRAFLFGEKWLDSLPPKQKAVTTIAKNIGKVFEQNFKNSCPKNVLVYRPPDAAQSFDMSSKLRFSQHSPCDFIIFSGKLNTLWTLELKTFEGSCSFERTKEDKGIIHYYQVESLKKFSTYNNVCSGFLLDFRKTGNTYFLMIDEWDDLINAITKKSFNENDLLNYANPILIMKKKLKVNYRYDIEGFLMKTHY